MEGRIENLYLASSRTKVTTLYVLLFLSKTSKGPIRNPDWIEDDAG